MDTIFLDEHSVLNGLGFAEAETDGRRSAVPNGIPLFPDGALHQFVVPTNSNAPVSLIARDNLVYELFFQLTRVEQLLTGEYNHFVYSTSPANEQNATASESAAAQFRVERNSTIYLSVARESFRRFVAAQRASGVEQLPAFEETGAVHCLRINAPPCCASLGDQQTIKSAFDLLNIARVESTNGDAEEARLEVTFRVGELDAAQLDKPLELSYTVYVFDEVDCHQDTVPLLYVRHSVLSHGDASLDESEASLASETVCRRLETLFHRVGLVTLLECPSCHSQFADLSDYVRHALHTHDAHRCPLCDVAFAAFEHLDAHLARCATRTHAAATERLASLAALGKCTQTDAAFKLEFDACTLVEAHLATLLGSPSAVVASKSAAHDCVKLCLNEPLRSSGSGNGVETVSVGEAEADAEGADMDQEGQDKQPELIAVQRGRGPIQIYGDFSCKFCGRLCKTYIGLKSHVTQGHREFYNKLLLHTLEKVKEMQLERVHADSAEAERLRMLDFDAAWNGDGELPPTFVGPPHAQTVPAGVNANALRWASASYAFFHELTTEMLQQAFERVLRELENGVGVLNDEVRFEQMRSRVGSAAYAAHVPQHSAAASVLEWRSSVNGEIKRIDERNKRSDAFFAYRKRIQQTNELIKMMERASQGDSNKRGLWNVLDVERLFQFVSGEQVQAASKLPSRYVRGKRPRGRPPKPETLGLPANASAEQIQQAQLALHAERLRSTKQMRIIAEPSLDTDADGLRSQCDSAPLSLTRSPRPSKSASVSASASCASTRNEDSLSDMNASECSAHLLGEPVDVEQTDDDLSDQSYVARCRISNGQFECLLCAASFTSQDSLLKHRAAHHKAQLAQHGDTHTSIGTSATSLRPFTCAVCSAHFATRVIFYRHVQLTRHENAEFSDRRMHTCALCSLSFRNEVFLRVHYNQLHKDVPCADLDGDAQHVQVPQNGVHGVSDNPGKGRKVAQPIRVIRAKQTTATPSSSLAPANTQRMSVNLVQKRPPRSNADASASPAVIVNSARKANEAVSGNPEVVYRCGLCESLFPSLADVITHQQELQVAQLRESRVKELDELHKREQLLLSSSLTEQTLSELAAARAQANALEQELGAAQAVQYFCRMCHTLFTSDCLAQQHAREVHASSGQQPAVFADNAHVAAGDHVSTPADLAAAFNASLVADTGIAQIE